ncbi:MAG: hypothetical protein BGO51_14895 [Rhodospirillales bacterium 69-11]|nr:hypothetical protein [Rhodospirillales bacterium]MBN8929741.1 hypothetical protein [Rhodospirillales bacterium]OJW29486.1 MAG: hypothetical protein BGO51_14895 [Rhodospirillales bacterium 69-11]
MATTAFDPAKLAHRISAALQTGGALQLGTADIPPDLDTAETVLFRVVESLGQPFAAWKLGASTTASRQAQGFDRAWSAPFLAAEVLTSPARLPAEADGMLGLECELVFRLGADMPSAGLLDAATVAGLVVAVQAGIEVPASRYPALGIYGAPALVADRGATGWLVIGEDSTDWTPAELDEMSARLLVNGVAHASGSGRDLIEGPFGALCDHLRRMQARGVPQPAGTLVSIGSLAGFCRVPAGASVTAEFAGLGCARLEIADAIRRTLPERG